MTDIKSPEERSRNMARIRSKDTKPEIYLRKLLFSKGLRYRKNVENISGHPDIYLAKYKTAIFVHGCFWHRHAACRFAYMPKSRVDFWQKKFEDNIKRDALVQHNLREKQIKCLIVWECTIHKMIKNSEVRDENIKNILDFLTSTSLNMEL